jgi:hypothetical protein
MFLFVCGVGGCVIFSTFLLCNSRDMTHACIYHHGLLLASVVMKFRWGYFIHLVTSKKNIPPTDQISPQKLTYLVFCTWILLSEKFHIIASWYHKHKFIWSQHLNLSVPCSVLSGIEFQL